jgi:hypothetical protein
MKNHTLCTTGVENKCGWRARGVVLKSHGQSFVRDFERILRYRYKQFSLQVAGSAKRTGGKESGNPQPLSSHAEAVRNA